jgi:hypothetical protein
MLRTFLRAKIHRATVTDANLSYEGSIHHPRRALMDAAHLAPYELVHVLDLDNGQRFETYVIEGRRRLGRHVYQWRRGPSGPGRRQDHRAGLWVGRGPPTAADAPVIVHVDAQEPPFP